MMVHPLSLAVVYSTGIFSTGAIVVGALLFSRVPAFLKSAESFATRIAALTAAVYCLWALLMLQGKSSALNFYADRATVLELLWRSTHGLGLTSPMSAAFFTGDHWFAAHFTPLVYLIYWVPFAVFPTQTTLNVLQVAIVASGAIPIWVSARRRLGGATAALVVIAYFLYPTVGYIGIYGPSFLEPSILLIGCALLFMSEDRPLPFFVAAIIALSVREEVGLVVAAIGAFAIIRGRRRQGLATMALGAIYTGVALKWVIPHFRSSTGLVYLANYASWGATPREILVNAAFHPVATIAKMATLPRFGNAVMYLLPLGFLPLLSPAFLVCALPNVATTFMSDSVTNYNFTLYYLAPTVPILFFASIDALESVRSRFKTGAARSAAAMLAGCALGAQIFFGPSPISIQFWSEAWKVGVFHTTNYHRSQYVAGAAAERAALLAARVPMTAQVSAEQHLLPLLYDRRRMLVFPTVDAETDYVLIDRSKKEKAGWAETYESFRADPERYYAAIEKDPRWTLVAEDGGARLFRRAEPR
ncbi:MAG: DUF2079 domain-containing protein [Elusimicrobia bacterium]|nr:DUF2079 domain-containing protein [Elusimicrobiota bacterium]